jgi:hypothetical protein
LSDIPEDVRAILAERAGPGLLALVTAIRTRYVEKPFEEHSGTGLLLTNQQGNTFCLTANHVVTPSSRVPTDSREVIQHFYMENIGRADKDGRIFLDDTSPLPPPFRLRRKYFKSERYDLAMLSSCLNGYELPGIRRFNYCPYSNVAGANLQQIFNEDVFAVCGFPSVLETSLPDIRLTNYVPLLHLFNGSHGENHPSDSACYSIKYSATNPSPNGLSGAPVWLLRERDFPSTPLDVNRVRACYTRGDPNFFRSWFAGIVTRYDKSAGLIDVTRPEICAEFSMVAEQAQPDLIDEPDDNIIKEQLDFWMERYGDRWR